MHIIFQDTAGTFFLLAQQKDIVMQNHSNSWDRLSYQEKKEVQRRIRQVTEQGRYIFTAPIGYERQRERRYTPTSSSIVLRKNPTLAPAMSSFFRELIAGRLHSYKDCAEWLNTQQTYKHFTPSQVKKLLDNPLYYGWLRIPSSYNSVREIVKCTNLKEAYLSKDEYDDIMFQILQEGWK